MIKNFLIVGLGGAVGSMLRYAVQKFFQVQTAAAFPTGTLARKHCRLFFDRHFMEFG